MNGGEHLQRARRASARYARMTAEDVVELGTVFMGVARRQAKDAASGLGGRLARSLQRVRR